METLILGDQTRVQQYEKTRVTWTKAQARTHETIGPLFLFTILGAFAWAVRGTWGYGGTSGGYVAGFWWGILFYYLAKIRGFDARWQALAIGIGIGFGGMNGYGQFLSWIHGNFGINSGTSLPIDPAIGFLWLTIIGIEWGGTAAALYGWTLTPNVSKKIKIYRIVAPAIGGLAGYLIVWGNPGLFFPHYTAELYESAECAIQCVRTASTLPSLAILLGIFLGLLLVETFLVKNRLVLKSILVMAVGFGIIFPVASLWFFMQDIISWHWWKVWEESIGAIGGFSIGIVYLWYIRHARETFQKTQSIPMTPPGSKADWHAHLALFLGLFALFVYTISGLSVPSLYHLGIKTDIEEWEYPIERILFLGIFGAIAIFFFTRHFLQTRALYRKGQSLFEVPNFTTRFLQLNFYLAFIGLVGIAFDVMMIFYFAFLWGIVLLTLRQRDFLRKYQLEL